MGNQPPSEYYCEDKGEIHEIGEQWSTENECNLKICQEHAVTLTQTCPEMPGPRQIPLGCKIVPGNEEERYPACCPRVECEEPEKISEEEVEKERKRKIRNDFEMDRIRDWFEDEHPEGFPYFKIEDYLYDTGPLYETSEQV